VLADAGIGDNGATIITIKPPEMISVLSGGQIAAFMAWEPYPSLAVTNDAGGAVLFTGHLAGSPLLRPRGQHRILEKHTAEVNALRRAHRKSIDYIENNPGSRSPSALSTPPWTPLWSPSRSGTFNLMSSSHQAGCWTMPLP